MMNVTTANTTAASFVATCQGATTVVVDQDIILMVTSEHAKVTVYKPLHLVIPTLLLLFLTLVHRSSKNVTKNWFA